MRLQNRDHIEHKYMIKISELEGKSKMNTKERGTFTALGKQFTNSSLVHFRIHKAWFDLSFVVSTHLEQLLSSGNKYLFIFKRSALLSEYSQTFLH